MQKIEMNYDDNHDEFQQAQQQVLTYHLSDQMPSSPRPKHPKKIITKISERHKLGLMSREREGAIDNVDYKQANRNIKKMQASMGRIIKIGPVIFKSNFQCGNIREVKLIAANTYEIELQKETNSNRVSGWFYFSVEGVKGEGHFIIKGYTKSSSLYNQGMKVCYRDAKDMLKWRRGGTRISYTNSGDQNEEERPKYQLRFSHFFKNNEVTCIQFAACFPYGLKKLYHLINNIKQTSECKILARSFHGQGIPLLTIGNKSSDKVIILSARVHPGETVSSFIMEGFLKQLVGDNQFGGLLRSHFLFKIVPMLNPDGVLKGNQRFSGYGCDLNRKWRSCKQSTQPEIYFMRELIKKINKEKQVVMYIDMHGHSRKKNVFFYGCCEKGPNSNPKPKQFPYLMQKIFNAFKYQNCCFAVQKDKEGTARVTVWKQLKIDYVYTLQSTLCGAEYGANYLQADYEKVGKKLCEGIAVFFYQEIQAGKNGQGGCKIVQKMAMLKRKAVEELMENPRLLEVGDQDDSGSESEPEIGQICQKDRNTETGLPKPDAYVKDFRQDHKLKKLKISTRFLSQHSIRQNHSAKIKSQIFLNEQTIRKQNNHTAHHKQRKINNTIVIENQKPRADKVEIMIANSINTFELDALRASSLYQKNVRVHSITRHNNENSERSKKVINPFTETAGFQDREEKIRLNLIHGREGAQYRRVRKLAQQSMKKQVLTEQSGKMVKGLNMNQLQIETNSKTNVVPRFYPSSQQRTRRASLESYIKKQGKQQFERFSINGDELKVRCISKHVFL